MSEYSGNEPAPAQPYDYERCLHTQTQNEFKMRMSSTYQAI